MPHLSCIEPAPITREPRPIEQDFLTFILAGEEYGLAMQNVQELRRYDTVTRVVDNSDFLKGVINLRGVIAPIIDMRIKFNLGLPVYDQFTVVIVLNVENDIVGLLVDSVSEVVTLRAEQIKCAPTMGPGFASSHLIGVGALGRRSVLLVDIEQMMSDNAFGLKHRLDA